MKPWLLLLAIVPTAAQAQSYAYAEALYARNKQTFTSEAAEPGPSRFTVRRLEAGRSLIEFVPPSAPEDGALPQWAPPTGYPKSHAGHLEWTVTIKPVAWESVTVPAGTFRALKVEINGRRGQDPDPFWQVKQAGRFQYTAWFAAGSLRPVKVHHRSWSMQDVLFGDETVELLAKP